MLETWNTHTVYTKVGKLIECARLDIKHCHGDGYSFYAMGEILRSATQNLSSIIGNACKK